MKGAFVSSVCKRHGDVVRVLLEKGLAKKDANFLLQSLLHQACQCNDEEAVAFLIENKSTLFEYTILIHTNTLVRAKNNERICQLLGIKHGERDGSGGFSSLSLRIK